MRDYQRHVNNPYYLEGTLYKRVLGVVRDYDRMRESLEEALDSSPAPPDGMPRGGKISSPTERKAIIRATISTQIDAVDKAMELVPKEYRKGIWDNITKFRRYPDDADRTTYARWKARFLWNVAKNQHLI